MTLHVASTPGCQLEGHPGHPCLLLKQSSSSKPTRKTFWTWMAEPPAQQKSVYVTHNKLRTVNLTRIHDMFVHVLYTCSDVLHLAVWHSRVRDVAKHQSVGRTSPLWWACTSLIHFQWNDHFKLCVICRSLALIIHHPSAFPRKSLLRAKHKVLLHGTALGPTASRVGRIRNWYCEAEARVNYIGKTWPKRLTIDENITHIISYQSKFQAASSCRVPKSCAAHPLPRSSCRCPGSSRSKGSTFDIANIRSELSFDLCRSSFFSVIFSWEFARLFVTEPNLRSLLHCKDIADSCCGLISKGSATIVS